MTDPARLRAKTSAILLANRAKREEQTDDARVEFARAAALEEEVFRSLAQAGGLTSS